jgi:acetylornithine deacetylase/succinyl-diaminopimelate desuccinylase-like protein
MKEIRNSEKIDKAFSKIDEFKVISTLRNLIKIPSYTGEESEKGDYLVRELERRGLEVVELWVERPGRRNVVGILRGDGTGKSLMLSAHQDTHTCQVEWPEAHEAVIKDGAVYGVGAGDSMGPMAAMLGAIDAIIRAGIELKGDLMFCGTVDEMGHKEGAKVLAESGLNVHYQIAGEPTDLQIGTTGIGKFEVEIRTKGSGIGIKHYGDRMGARTINAVISMHKIIQYLLKMAEEDPYFNVTHPMLPGKGAALNIGPIIGGGTGFADPLRKIGKRAGQHGLAWSPTWCRLRVGCRYWPGQTSREFMEVLNKWIEKAKAEDPSIEVEVEPYLDGEITPIDVPEDAEIVQILKRTTKYATGVESRRRGDPYSLEAPFYERRGIQAVWLGPGVIPKNGFATPQEHVRIEDVIKACRIYTATAIEICA